MEARYINSNGKELKLQANNLMVTSADLFQREYTISSGTGLPESKDIKYKLTITLRGAIEEQKILWNKIYDIFETDVNQKTTGRLYYGDYYIDCFVITSSTAPSSLLSSRTDIDVGIYCPKQRWLKEVCYDFYPHISLENEVTDYPYDYNYDYYMDMLSENIVNESVGDCDFEMIIFGSCKNPSVIIDHQIYNVNADIMDSEYLVINSKTKKIYKVQTDGTQINQFHLKNDEFYIFEKIKSGTHKVSWNGKFGFKLNLIVERSEPKWI